MNKNPLQCNVIETKRKISFLFLYFQKSIFLVDAKETQKDLFQLQQLEIIKHGERSTNNPDNS